MLLTHFLLQVFYFPLQVQPTSPWGCWSWTEAFITTCWRPPTHFSLRCKQHVVGYSINDCKGFSRTVNICVWSFHVASHWLTAKAVFQRGFWLPREASIHLLLATPQSSIPRDMSLDLSFNPRRLLLRITHPLKTIHIQGWSQRNTISRTPSFCQGLMLKMCCFLRATRTWEEYKIRKAGAVDWWRSLLYSGKYWEDLYCDFSVEQVESENEFPLIKDINQFVVCRAWSTLRPSCLSRGRAITLKPNWPPTDIPWSSLLTFLADWAGRPASLPLWRTCSEKLRHCQVLNRHNQITCTHFL